MNDTYKKIYVFDDKIGFIQLLAVYGNDIDIVNAARVSTVKFKSNKSCFDKKDEELINYLMFNKHTSPFEQVSYKFRFKMPLFVIQELLRHRTAHINQQSSRYSQMKREFYAPKKWRISDTVDKQSSIESNKIYHDLETEHYIDACIYAFDEYEKKLQSGIAKEMARMCLPHSTYSSLIWQIDLHNLFHFLELRCAQNAQWEIRQYANAMKNIVKKYTPWAFEAFEKYLIMKNQKI